MKTRRPHFSTLMLGLCGVLLMAVVLAETEELQPEVFAAFAVTPTPRAERSALTLGACIGRALAQNIDIAIERLNPELALADIQTAQGPFDPRLRVSGDYSENSNPRLAEQVAADGRSSVNSRSQNAQTSIVQDFSPGTELSLNVNARNSQSTFNQFSDEFSTGASVTLRQPLLRNFGTDTNLAPLRIARRGLGAADASFQFRVEQTVADVANAYYEFLYSRRDLDGRRASLSIALQLLEENRYREQLGTMSRLDVSQANAEVASRQENVLLAEAAEHLAENDLKRLITTEMLELLDRVIDPIEPTALMGPNIQSMDAIRDGLFARADLKEAREKLEAQRLRVTYQKNQLLPLLDLRASAGLSGLSGDLDRSFDNVGRAKDPQWLVGLTVEFPLGNRELRGRLRATEIQQQQSLLLLKKMEQQVIQEVDNAATQTRINNERIKTTFTARVLASENLEAEMDKLNAGASTSFIVLRLQRDLDDARTRELRAQADYQKSIIELLRAQGKLLPAFQVQIAN